MALFRRKSAAAAPSSRVSAASLAHFRSQHPELPEISSWQATMLPCNSPDDDLLEIWTQVVEPEHLTHRAAVLLLPDASIRAFLAFESTTESSGLYYIRTFCNGGDTRRGPYPGPLSDQTWVDEAGPAYAGAVSAFLRGERLTQLSRVRADEYGPYRRFTQSGMNPGLSSWLLAETVLDIPPQLGRIELWSGAVASGEVPYEYPFLLGVHSPDGELAAVIAAEAMPSVHTNVYLGVFTAGEHSNFGADERLLNTEHFMESALPLAMSVLDQWPRPWVPNLITYRALFELDFGSGLCLHADNDRARADFDFVIDHDLLPLSPATRAMVDDLCTEYDTALNWESPSGPGLWRKNECDQFNVKAMEILHVLRTELGPQWEIVDNFVRQSQDPDLDRYLADPEGFWR